MSLASQGSSKRNPESQRLISELQSEVSLEAAPFLQFILKRAGAIVAALLLFVAALAGTAGYQWYASRAALDAQKALARVMGTQEDERVAALERFAAAAPASVRTAAWLALGSAAAARQDSATAARAYAEVATADADGPLGFLAAFNEAQALMRAGESAKALPVLEKLEKTMPEAHRSLVRGVLAEAALLAGQPQRAKQIFEALATSARGGDADYFLYRARSL